MAAAARAGLNLANRLAALAFALLTVVLLALYLTQSYARVPVRGAVFALVGGLVVGLGLAISPRRAPWRFSAAFLLLGAAIYAFHRVPLAEALPTLADFRTLVGIIVLVPIVGFIFEVRNYGAALLALAARRARSEAALLSALALLSSLVAAMTSVAALVVVQQLLGPQARRHERWSRLLGTANLRGFIAANVWAPSAASISVALHFTGARLDEFLPRALVPAGLMLVLHALSARLERGEPKWQPHGAGLPAHQAARQSGEFLLLLALFFGSMVVVERASGLPLINVVPAVCLAYAAAFFVLTGRGTLFARRLARYLLAGVPLKSSEIVLVLSAGFLIGALRLSGLGEQFAAAFQGLVAPTPPLLLVAMPSLIILLSLVGVPPMVTLLLLAGTVDPAATSGAPGVFAAALSLGVAVATMFSPFAVPIFLLASVAGRSTVQVSVQWNWAFGLVFYTLALGYLLVLLP